MGLVLIQKEPQKFKFITQIAIAGVEPVENLKKPQKKLKKKLKIPGKKIIKNLDLFISRFFTRILFLDFQVT